MLGFRCQISAGHQSLIFLMCFCVCLSLCDLSEEKQAALPHCSHHKLPGTLYLSGSPAGRLHPLYETQVGECLFCEGFSRAE